MFCDEHGRFLSEEIDWTVYKRLLTTNEADAMHLHGEGDLTPQAKLKWRLPLSTEDLEP